MTFNGSAVGVPYAATTGSGKTPPLSKNLISWTFKVAPDSLYSRDVVSATAENARFISSYCADFTGDGAKYMVTPFGVGTGTSWTFECDIITKSGSFSSPACLVAMAAGGVQIYAGTTAGAWGYYDGTLYNANTALSVDTKYTLKVVRNGTSLSFFINGVADGSPTISTSINSTYYRFGSQLDGNNPWTGRLIWAKFQTAGVTVGEYYFSGGYFDVSGNGNHLTNTNISLKGLQDYTHRNIVYGCDIYSQDAAPTDRTKDIYVPYLNGSPIVTSLTGYTKISSNPAGSWHNGCETKIVVGTTGVKDATGWIAVTSVKTQNGTTYSLVSTAEKKLVDNSEIFINHTTSPVGYCKEIDINTMPAVSLGDYVFLDTSTTNRRKNLIWYPSSVEPENNDSVLVHRFVNKTDFVTDVNGDYIFDVNNHVITVV